MLWANLYLLFWLSLIPFVTAWMGENHFASLPTAVYGLVLLMAAIGYKVLQTTIVNHGSHDNEMLASAIGSDLKGYVSIACYVAAIPLAFVHQLIAGALYAAVAFMWLVPDRRIETRME